MNRLRSVIGLSGGVDSSLAAALAVEAGHEAIGVIVHQLDGASRCCSLEDARRVCAQLGMRFYVVNRVERFRREIMEPFADAYLGGSTPIPCVACNKGFKFDVLRARARAFAAERVVTGHYARVETDSASGLHRLLRGRDREKDQSYFLFQLGQATLADVWFPLGELTKDEVRQAARERGLATADKPESHEICFVPGDDYATVVESLRPGRAREGALVSAEGVELGRHAGVHRFTIGQRRGLGVAAGERLYVTALDAASGRVVLGSPEDLAVNGARIDGVSWVAGRAPAASLVEVQVRYRHAPVKARLRPLEGDAVELRFEEPVRAAAPGQAAVFYDGDEVLGGGTLTAACR